jgi:hypothetical protein
VHEHKSLYALPSVNFSGIEIPLRVRHNLVDPVKLAGVSAIVSGLSKHRAILAAQRPDHIVLAVCDK